MNVKEKIKKKYLEGISIRQISRDVERSTSYIETVLNNSGLKGDGATKLEERFASENFIAICKKTGRVFDDFRNQSGILTSHIIDTYGIEIPTKYLRKQIRFKTGFYWHEEYFLIQEKEEEQIETYSCRLCDHKTSDLINRTGAMTKHIASHNVSIETYVKLFPEDEYLFQTTITKAIEKVEFLKDSDNFLECAICNEKLKKITNTHTKKHGLSLSEYRKSFCNNTLSKNSRDILRVEAEKNFSKAIRSRKGTNIELMLMAKMDELGVKYEKQYKKGSFFYDFYLPVDDLLIEVDGLYWHGHDRESCWNKTIFNNIINDFRKTQPNLIRLVEEKSLNSESMIKITSQDEFYEYLKNNHLNILNHKLFNLIEGEIIFSKEYCIKDHDNLNDEKLIKNIAFLWKTFYSPGQSSKFLDTKSRKGDSKLKSILFNEFNRAKKLDQKDLFELFENEELLKKVIKYRLGLNESKEFFKFNIKNLYRGIEVRTMYNVGILPSKQSREIYENYNDLSSKKTIFDPFSGWGSRMIGANNLNLKYIGVDINLDVVKKYSDIIQEFNLDESKIDVRHHDSTIQISELVNSIDFIFTSPPFFNDEVYSKDHKLFASMDEFKKELLIPVFKNCHSYLKDKCKMVIDMKEAYCQDTIEAAVESGFELCKSESYSVRKTHFSKNKDPKKQFLLEFIKS